MNKFRPYVGAGVMYAYFNELEMNSGIESDLIKAGHMIQNIHDGKAGAALDGKTSSAKPIVKLEATDTFAPIVTLGQLTTSTLTGLLLVQFLIQK